MSTTAPSSANSSVSALQKFIMGMAGFMDALLHKFKDDQELIKQRRRLQTMVIDASPKMRQTMSQKLITEFHTAMSPYYQRIMQADDRVIFEIKHETFKEMKFDEKYAKCNKKTQKVMFVHLQGICRQAELHHGTSDVPANIMSKVYDVSAKHIADTRAGRSLDMSKVWADAMQVVTSSTSAEQQGLAQAMSGAKIQGIMSNVMRSGAMGTPDPRAMAQMQAMAQQMASAQQQTQPAQQHAQGGGGGAKGAAGGFSFEDAK